MVEKLLEIDGVSKSFGDLVVLQDLNLTLRRGEKIAILGISGSGKTTLLNIICGLLSPDDGKITINQESIDTIPADRIRSEYIAMIFQNFELFGHMTALDNVMATAMFKRASDRENIEQRAVEHLRNLGMENHLYKYPDQLSGGQKQRVGIARALINQPFIIIADEPTSSLDTATKRQIMKTILSTTSDERGLIYATHDISIARSADRALILRDGQLHSIEVADLESTKKIKTLYR